MKQNRESYSLRLRAISDEGDWTGWVAFFLEAIKTQALANTEKVRQVLHLYETMKGRIIQVTHSQYSPIILDILFNRPIFQSTDFTNRSEIPDSTGKAVLRKLKDAKIVTPIQEASGSRPAIFAFPDLLNITEGKKVL